MTLVRYMYIRMNTRGLNEQRQSRRLINFSINILAVLSLFISNFECLSRRPDLDFLKIKEMKRCSLTVNGCRSRNVGYWMITGVRSICLDIGQVLLFACLWTEAKSRFINWKGRTRPISSHLDRTSLVNKGFIYINYFREYFSCGTQRVVPRGQDPSWESKESVKNTPKWHRLGLEPALEPDHCYDTAPPRASTRLDICLQ